MSSKLAAEIKDYDAAVKAIEESLAKLDIGYIDLMLIHAPQPWTTSAAGNYDEGNRAAWRALEEAHQAGKLRAIGVSNFLEQDVQNIIDGGTVVPHVKPAPRARREHPHRLAGVLRGQGHPRRGVTRPSRTARSSTNADLKTMAGKYDVSVAQLCVRYVVQLGTVALPKTANPEHMASNADIDFVISDDDITTLRQLHERDFGDSSAFPVYSGK